MLFGGAAGAFLCWWCTPVVVPPPYAWFVIVGPFVAALFAAAVETIPIRLDDNLSVSATAAAVLWWLSLVSEETAVHAASAAAGVLPLALALSARALAALRQAGYPVSEPERL